MTSAEQIREAMSRSATTVSIAGIPWPAYKVVALLVGLLVFAIVALVTTAAALAVLGGAGVCLVVWVGLGPSGHLTR
ncbi:MAG: hypothetical protein ACPGVG_17550 [Mycobacterium sp.]